MTDQDQNQILIKLKPVTSDMFSVTFSKFGTILELKQEVSQKLNAEPDQIRLIYKGQILKDPQTVDSYGIAHEHVVHLVKSKPTPSKSAAVPSGITAEQLSNVNRPADPLVKHFESLGITGEAAEQQARSMREMMASPQFQSMMSSPDAVRAMFESSPATRQMMQEYPELRQMLNNPEELQRMARIMANPALSREFLRGMDLSLNSAEAMGFTPQLASLSSSVNRALEQVADEAAQEADLRRQQQQQASANPFAALFGAPVSTSTTAGQTSASTEGAALPWANTHTPNITTNAMPSAGMPDLSSLFGGAVSGMGGGPGTVPNREARAMIQQMMSNPSTRELYSNQLRTMIPFLLASQPGLRSNLAAIGMGDLDTNPQTMDRFIALSTDPSMYEMAERLEEAMGRSGGDQMNAMMNLLSGSGAGTGLGSGGSFTPSSGVGGGINTGSDAMMMNPEALARLSEMFGGGSAGPLPNPPPADPETEYASQLQQLNDMGFWDREANIRVLIATRGNVNAAVERLLSSP